MTRRDFAGSLPAGPSPRAPGRASASWFGEDGITMLVARGATAEEAEGLIAGVPEFMFLARRNGNGVAGLHFGHFSLQAHSAAAGGDEINFLALGMIMLLGARADGQARLRQALVADGRIAIGQQFADFRAVFGDEARRHMEVFDFHTEAQMLNKFGGRGKSNLRRRSLL